MRSKFTWNISARLKETTTRDKHFGLRLIFHVLVCSLAYAFLPTNAYANTCGPPPEISGKVHLVSNYLRFYPEPEFAYANSLAAEELITGLSADDGHIVYSDSVVNGNDEVMEVILPIWMHTSRLDITSMTTGDIGYTVGRVYNPDNPTDISNVADGGFVLGANNLPVVAFGCSVGVFTLTFVRGYFYRLTQLPYYLEYLGDVSPGPQTLPSITAASASYSQTSGEITVDFESNGDFDRRLVMIDSDDTFSSGYSGGFDYLLENGYLYNYIGNGTDWLWNALGTTSGSTGDQAFDQVAQWSFSIPDITVNAPVRFFIENDNPSASDELYSTITGVTINPVVVGPFTPADSADKFANPDRGLYKYSTISIRKSDNVADTHIDANGFPLAAHRNDHEYCWNGQCGPDRYTNENLKTIFTSYRNDDENFSLMLLKVEMPNEANSDNLPPGLLEEIDRVLSVAKQAGLKVIFRGVYRPSNKFCQNVEYEPSNINTVKTHISQLAGVINNNIGAVAYVEAGMVGAWGEWNCTTLYRDPSGTVIDTLETRSLLVPDIVGTWLQELPTGFVGVRTPRMKFDNYPANSGGDESRVSFYNDCFLYDEKHQGTYESANDIGTREQQRDYVQQQTQSVPIGGEPCGWDSNNFVAPQSDDIYAPNSSLGNFCDKGQQALRDYRFTYLNNRNDEQAVWIRNWIEEGCWDEVQKNMGYRFDLEKVELTGTLNLGGTLNIDLWVTNNGYAKLYKERDVEIVFTRTDGSFSRGVVLPNVNPTNWLPGQQATRESTTINIPSTWPPGRYELGLRLLDRDNPGNHLHSIRFANSGWSEQDGGTQIFASDADNLSVSLTTESNYVITANSGQSGQ